VHPAKAVGRNEMSFGRDTFVVPSIMLHGPPVGPQEDWEVGTSSSQQCHLLRGYFGPFLLRRP